MIFVTIVLCIMSIFAIIFFFYSVWDIANPRHIYMTIFSIISVLYCWFSSEFKFLELIEECGHDSEYKNINRVMLILHVAFILIMLFLMCKIIYIILQT